MTTVLTGPGSLPDASLMESLGEKEFIAEWHNLTGLYFDRLGFCKPSLTVHDPSHDASDFNHMFILHKHRMVNRGFSLKVHPEGNLPYSACTQSRLDPISSLFFILWYVLKCLNKNCPQKGTF